MYTVGTINQAIYSLQMLYYASMISYKCMYYDIVAVLIAHVRSAISGVVGGARGISHTHS